ncbi:unnamed protein product [Effrenium voratum]|nr:unnamed protein product [Effrenium voratum]
MFSEGAAACAGISDLPERPTAAGPGKGKQILPLGRWLQRFFSLRNRQFWNYSVSPRNYFFQRRWSTEDLFQFVFVVAVHLGACAAPFFFTWKAFGCFCAGYILTGMLGITLSYHRQLSHRAFVTPKWLEYFFAYCGALAVQGPPISWVSSHRHHHGNTDSQDDVHSPRDGFWWSHMGWLMDSDGTKIRRNKQNASDLSSQPFYRFMQRTYALHSVVLPILGLYAFGGLPCVLWGFFARVLAHHLGRELCLGLSRLEDRGSFDEQLARWNSGLW